MHPADRGGNLTKRPRSFMEYLLETDERFRGFLLRDLARRTRSFGWDLVRCRDQLPVHSDSTCSSDSTGEYDITVAGTVLTRDGQVPEGHGMASRYAYLYQGDASPRRPEVRKRSSLQSFRSATSVGSRASVDQRRHRNRQRRRSSPEQPELQRRSSIQSFSISSECWDGRLLMRGDMGVANGDVRVLPLLETSGIRGLFP
jgi:hypothetical protein